jgi:alkylated DNA repair protein (DNA oxidative demethylase)
MTTELREIASGAVHLPGWLPLDRQAFIVEQFHAWAAGPVPIRAATVRGHQMSVRTVCLGWHWQPYRYTREAGDVNGRRVLPMPGWLVALGRAAVSAVGDPGAQQRWLEDTAATYEPDTALVNFYDSAARLGMHQDKDEISREPVVSLSVGDRCIFRFGNPHTRGRPYVDLELASGDLFVFGGESRLAYHGVTKIIPGTAPIGCGLNAGRINITLRVTGLRSGADDQ